MFVKLFAVMLVTHSNINMDGKNIYQDKKERLMPSCS